MPSRTVELALAAAAGALAYFVLFGRRSSRINTSISLDQPKVVHIVDFPTEIESCGEKKKAYCRCWKSAVFPYCDGAHAKLNQQGDNVGPIVIKA